MRLATTTTAGSHSRASAARRQSWHRPTSRPRWPVRTAMGIPCWMRRYGRARLRQYAWSTTTSTLRKTSRAATTHLRRRPPRLHDRQRRRKASESRTGLRNSSSRKGNELDDLQGSEETSRRRCDDTTLFLLLFITCTLHVQPVVCDPIALAWILTGMRSNARTSATAAGL